MGRNINKNISAAAKMRSAAEERLRSNPADLPDLGSEESTQRLVHELQVHQIELEMQNDELRQTRDELDTALEKCTELYDFAPVGYVTLDRGGVIIATNLTGASLLGIESIKA